MHFCDTWIILVKQITAGERYVESITEEVFGGLRQQLEESM